MDNNFYISFGVSTVVIVQIMASRLWQSEVLLTAVEEYLQGLNV
jgi:hypothetical protein